MSAQARRRLAFHEAGHAVISAAIHDSPRNVSIIPDRETLGRCMILRYGEPANLIRVHLAGRAAEHHQSGRRPSKLTSEIASAVIVCTGGPLPETAEEIEGRDEVKAIRRLLEMGVPSAALISEAERWYQQTRKIVSRLWAPITAVAEALLIHHELDEDAFDAAVGAHWTLVYRELVRAS